MMLVHDCDENKEVRHEHLSDQLGANYCRLPVREIENLLTPEVLKKVLDHYKKKDRDSIDFDENIKQSDYGMVPFGEFIWPYIEDGQIKKICARSSAKSIPVLYNKADFAFKAISFMDSWERLSPAAKKLTVDVYNFIKANNGL